MVKHRTGDESDLAARLLDRIILDEADRVDHIQHAVEAENEAGNHRGNLRQGVGLCHVRLSYSISSAGSALATRHIYGRSESYSMNEMIFIQLYHKLRRPAAP